MCNVTIGEGLLLIRLGMFTDAFRGITTGLLGNFNKNPADDYIPRNSVISLASPDEQTLYEQFGLTCKYSHV